MTVDKPRFERKGGAPNLPAEFTHFVKNVLKGRSLDDNFEEESTEGEFPDFGLYRDLVLIEMKHLETDQTDRIQAVMDVNLTEDELPFFCGQRRIEINNESFSNGDEVVRAILNKLNRSLETLLSKANRQFRSYRGRHPRKNAVNICVILNSVIRDYTPEIVSHAIHSKMRSREGNPRFESLDAVLYISEKHFTKIPDGRTAHPVLSMKASVW